MTSFRFLQIMELNSERSEPITNSSLNSVINGFADGTIDNFIVEQNIDAEALSDQPDHINSQTSAGQNLQLPNCATENVSLQKPSSVAGMKEENSLIFDFTKNGPHNSAFESITTMDAPTEQNTISWLVTTPTSISSTNESNFERNQEINVGNIKLDYETKNYSVIVDVISKENIRSKTSNNSINLGLSESLE